MGGNIVKKKSSGPDNKKKQFPDSKHATSVIQGAGGSYTNLIKKCLQELFRGLGS